MSVVFDNNKKIFKLDTYETSYVFRLSHGKYLTHLYYGAKVDGFDFDGCVPERNCGFAPYTEEENGKYSPDTELQEYSCFGTGDMRTDALRLKRGNGCRDTRLTYVSHSITDGRPSVTGMPYSRSADGVKTLSVTLCDEESDAEVQMYYCVYERENVITRFQIIKNNGKEKLVVEKVASCCLDFYYDRQTVITLPGNYGLEQRFQQSEIPEGRMCFESISGITSHIMNPFIAVASRGATEDFGDVIGCNLVYSGNFSDEIERTYKNTVRLTAGINPKGFSWILESGESFCTPEAVLTFSPKGLGGMSRNFHRHIERNIVPEFSFRPIVMNTWEGFFFNIDDKKLIECAQQAASIGIDTIVLDDGWFENRIDDTAGLGDWIVDKKKFPDLAATAKKINALGIRFGIWIEPEMVSENSLLYKNHPEWCLNSGRKPSLQRNQFVLDMCNDRVVEYLFGRLSDLFSGVNIEYVKWDVNRYLSEVGSKFLSAERQGETAHRYMLGVYKLYGKLREAFPHIFFENCGGGGGRFDLGMLFYSPQIWLSDNTNPFDRAKIQHSCTLAYPPSVISAHVTDGLGGCTFQKSDLEFRYAVASNFSLGYELDVRKLDAEEMKKIAEFNKRYVKLKEIIFGCDFYRIESPYENDGKFAVWQVVSADGRKTIVTALQLVGDYNKLWKIVRLKGLDADAVYRNSSDGKLYKGDMLMNAGIALSGLVGNGASLQIELERIK